MEGQITEAVKGVRSDKMLELHNRRAREYEESMKDKYLEVLLEEEMWRLAKKPIILPIAGSI